MSHTGVIHTYIRYILNTGMDPALIHLVRGALCNHEASKELAALDGCSDYITIQMCMWDETDCHKSIVFNTEISQSFA